MKHDTLGATLGLTLATCALVWLLAMIASHGWHRVAPKPEVRAEVAPRYVVTIHVQKPEDAPKVFKGLLPPLEGLGVK